jgi:adenylate cyclase
MNRPLRRLSMMAGVAAGFMALLLVVSNGGLLSHWALDRLWDLNGPYKPVSGEKAVLGDQVVIIAIDNPTLRMRRGSHPRLPRRVYADLITRLTEMGARLIGTDITFDEPGDPTQDAALRDAVASSGRVITNCFRSRDEFITSLWIDGRAFFRDVARGEGFADVPLDRDHFVRRIFLYAPTGALEVRAGLALAVYLADIGRTDQDVVFEGSHVAIPHPFLPEKTRIPVDYRGRNLIGFLGGPGSLPTYSAHAILEGDIASASIQGKIALIGGTAEEFRDSFHTPFSPQGDLAGVELHGHILENLYLGRFPREWSGPRWWAAVVLFAALWGAFSGLIRPERAAVLLGPLALIWLPVNIWLFVHHHLFINMFDVWAALGLGWLAALVVDMLILRQEKAHISTLFGRYVSPALLKELLDQPEAITLGGARREAVVLFADVRGFTSICEERPPEDVITFLNTYFAAVTRAIQDRSGILNKFIGDGLMAFFGVPINHGNEAERAVTTALAMKQALVELRQKFPSEELFPIRDIGIGIHGGDVVVGNVGSEFHMEYTLLGDTVNVSARLEAMCRRGEILVTEWVHERLPAQVFVTKPRGRVAVRGRSEEVIIFEILGRVGEVPALPESAPTPAPDPVS